MTTFSRPIRYRNAGGHDRAEHATELLKAGVAVGDRAVDGLLREHDPDADRDHDCRVAEREEEADAERPLSLVHQLAGGVVDRRDVVSIEGVAQSERVRQARDADPEALVVGWNDEQHEDREPDDVQGEYRGEHRAGANPLPWREGPRDVDDVAGDSEPPATARGACGARHAHRLAPTDTTSIAISLLLFDSPGHCGTERDTATLYAAPAYSRRRVIRITSSTGTRIAAYASADPRQLLAERPVEHAARTEERPGRDDAGCSEVTVPMIAAAPTVVARIATRISVRGSGRHDRDEPPLVGDL